MERVADVAREDGCARGPLYGLFDDLDEPDSTLAVALESVVDLCAEGACAISATELAVSIAVCDASGADAAVYSDRVRSRAQRTAGGIAALQMYTLEFSGTSMFAALNGALRSKVRAKCAPFRRYIWMLMHAMREAPAFEGPAVYRGVREDLRATYKKGRTVTWSGFSSCTSSLEVLQNEQFCGASEERTIFIIALTQGRARWIADVSMVETEDEVLLPPNTRVRVDSTLDAGSGLVLVGLTELEPLDPILLFGAAEAVEAADVPVPLHERNAETRLEGVPVEADQDDAESQYHIGLAYSSDEPVDKAMAVAWYLKAAEQGHKEAQHAVGDAYYDGDGVQVDKAAAVLWWSKAAEQGHSAAQYAVGYALYHGDCVHVDTAAAVEWLRKAAEQGHAEAQDLLGIAYFCGHGVPMDKAAGVVWLRQAAERGHTRAQFQLALAHFEGDGVPVDKVAGVVWLRQAAEQGHTHAQCRLGQAYHEGTGVPVDETAALEWWRKAEMSLRRGAREQDEDDAAEHGDEDAQYSMGHALYYGDGVTVDKAAGLAWWRKAAEKGHTVAQRFLDHYTEPSKAAIKATLDGDAEACFYRGLAYRDGSGVEKDDAEALRLLIRAAETHVEAQVELGHMYYAGDGLARCREAASILYTKARNGGSTDALMLGRVHFNGDGVTRDAKEAARWYTVAAEQGSRYAQLHMGKALCYGYGVAVDKQASVRWYTKAAVQGLAEAQFALGRVLLYGIDVPVDKELGIGWLRKAAEQGHAKAQYSLGTALLESRVPDDRNTALEWLIKAADQGNKDAQELLCMLYSDVTIHKAFVPIARHMWLLESASQGSELAQYVVAQAHREGYGVPVDQQAATGWYKKAADKGHPDAQVQLGLAYYTGIGVLVPDKQAGLDWFEKAAAQGHVHARALLVAHNGDADARLSLGFASYARGAYDEAAVWYCMEATRGDAEAQFIFGGMHGDGLGVPKNARLACEWYRRAAEQGHTEAMVELGLAGQFGFLVPDGE